MAGESELMMECVMYRKPNTVKTKKSNKTRLHCHLIEISDERTVNKLFLETSDRKGRGGRPKLTCLGCTENNLKSMDVKRWSEKQKTENPP